MKKSAALWGAALALLLFGSAASAQDTIKQITPDEALFDVGHAGRGFIDVEGGYYANKVYVERWRFDNSLMNFQKLSGHTYFTRSSFNEERSRRRYCGEDPAQNCAELEVKQYSKNLISLVYRRVSDGAVCVGLDYVGESGRSSDNRPRIYGNFLASLIHCRAPGTDREEVLAHGAHYLAAAKKDGRTVAKLKHLDLPKLPDPNAAPSRVGTPDAAYAQAPNRRVCNMATENGAWQQQRSLQKWVDEAKSRGLSPTQCGRILSSN